MVNTYFKILNNNTVTKYKESLIMSVQNELKQDFKEDNILLESLFASKRYSENIDMNTLLKVYLLDQLLKTKDTYADESNYIDTANPDIKKYNKTGKFYKFVKNQYKYIPEIIEVNDDGTYITLESKSTSKYQIKRTYSKNHKVLKFQLVTPDGNIVNNKWHVIEILNLKKEYAQKYKYSGFSGNCSDIASTILNYITKPIETGYYMDNTYNIYRWNNISKSFEVHETNTSPLLIDYEFKSSNVVIRKEYKGAA